MASAESELGFSFTNIARKAGLHARTVYGAEGTNTYLIETTGSGVAVIDYDGDGWVDIFMVNGSRLDGSPKGQEPTNHLYRNRRDGTFEDVTARAGLALGGGGRQRASVITTTTDMTISTSRTGVRTICTATTATGSSTT